MFRALSSIPLSSLRGASTVLWFAAALACAGCTAVPERDAASALPGAASPQAALHAHVQHLVDRYGVCDVAVAVVRNRELQAVDAAHGCNWPIAPASDMVFEAASLSKPVFAYAVLKLVQQGKMDLDAPVLTYLPQGYAHRHFAHLAASPVDQVTDPKLRDVTVRMALNHTSGLPNWSDGPLAFAGTPGARWQYSGEGYVLLQRAVEAVTGEKLGDYMQRTVFAPLGMAHSAYTRKAELEKFIVPGTSFYGDVLKPIPFYEAVAAFSLYTSAGDYGRFLAALLKDEPMLRQIAESPVPVDTRLELSWGQGWGLARRRGDMFLWHWGNNPGYKAFVMASPRTGDGFVMFTNSDKGQALAEPVGTDVFPGTHQVYRFPLLRDGLDSVLCDTFDICP
jgi:CubicO group peptidase (beta-lactamase class C family)